jgi:hypothetical protein
MLFACTAPGKGSGLIFLNLKRNLPQPEVGPRSAYWVILIATHVTEKSVGLSLHWSRRPPLNRALGEPPLWPGQALPVVACPV